MLKWWGRAAAVTAVAALSGAAVAASTVAVTAPKLIGSGELAENSEVPALATSPDGKRWIAYFTADGKLLFRSLDGGDAQSLYTAPKGPAQPSRAALVWAGPRAHVLLRPKVGANKWIEVLTSRDGGAKFSAPTRISQGGGALLPIHFERGEGNLLAAMWLDERTTPKLYAYYANVSRDGGDSFLPQEVKISGDYGVGSTSTLVVRRQEIYAAFVGHLDKKSHVVVRRSDDFGKSWSEQRVAELAEGESGGPMASVATADRIYVFWATGESGVRGASTADGRSWTQLSVPEETKDLDIGNLQVTASAAGEVVVAFFARRLPATRTKIYAVHSPDRGVRWLPMHQLNGHPHSELTYAMAPRLAADGKGTVVVVWEDHRNIRGNAYLTYSRDWGRTWAAQNTLVDDRGTFNGWFPQILKGADDKYTVVFFRYDSDRRDRGKYYVAEAMLPPGPVSTAPPSPSLVEGEMRGALLRARVEDFWKGMIANDWMRLYDFYDPFYRTKETRNKFVGGRGNMIYHAAEIVSMQQMGSIADVKVKVSIEVPPLDLIDKKRAGVPRQDRILDERWLWLDHNWYREFRGSMMQEPFAPY